MSREMLPAFGRGRRARLGPVRVIGAALILGGIAVAGFVGYEVWVTDIIAGRGQAQLVESLESRRATAVPETRPYDAAALPDAPIALPAEIRLAEPGPAASPSPRAAEGLPDPATPAVIPGEDLAGPAQPPVVVTESVPFGGDAVGRIVIPRAEVDWAVVEGVGSAQLRTGAGHMPGTALPGEPGNAVISGHRTTYGAPFAHLERLVPGDPITVETATGTHTYAVVETRIVGPTEIWVIEQWRGAWLTLTTCHPRYSAAERLVVFAHLVAGPNAGVILASP